MNIEIGARVRTSDDRDVGAVHRVVVDLERQAVASIVVLKGRLLSRDILVPLEYVERADEGGVMLRLTEGELEKLPDFSYNEILTPPPTWAFPLPYPGGAVYIPVSQRERLGGNEVDLTPGVKVYAIDGEVGEVEEVEIDPRTGQVDAFWIKTGGLGSHDLRVPAEWVDTVGEQGIRLVASRDELGTQLGPESQARTRA
jgi:sporulation protein YlmC with PRC-barrel domain